MIRAMVDIETAGTGAHALVLSIGAVKWGEYSEELLVYPDHNTQESDGRSVSLDTMKWWMEQGAEAQAVFNKNPQFPDVAASQLEAFLRDADEIWANGPDFDCVILADYMKQYNPRYRWPFWKHRCFRTFRNVFSDYVGNEARGVAHDALDDAKYQAKSLQNILRTLREKGIRIEE